MPSLVGNKPNQVPTNGDLGTLAFQDANAVNITGGSATLGTATINGGTATLSSATVTSATLTTAVATTLTANSRTLNIDHDLSNISPTLLLDFANTKTLDPRITFTRGSTGTFYDGKTVAKAEENLLLHSQDFTNAAWLIQAGVTITGNTVAAPDGTTTAETITATASTNDHRFYQLTLSTTGTQRVFSVFAKAGTHKFLQIALGGDANAQANFDLTAGAPALGTVGSAVTATITNVGNDWYRCTIVTSSASVNTVVSFGLISSTTAARFESWAAAGTETVFLWGAQVEQRSAATAYTATTTAPITNYIPALQTAASGQARFTHDPLTGESLGLLIEEQRTNLALRSDDFANASWTKSASSVLSNSIVAPDGTLTGDKIVEDTTNASHVVLQSITLTAATHTASAYFKAGERSFVRMILQDATPSFFTAFFDLSLGTVGTISGTGTTASITAVGNGWYRCSVTATTVSGAGGLTVRTATANGTDSYTGNGYAGVFVWGAQLEAGAFATSYIPTVASTVTRSADAASMTGTNFTSWYRADEGTIYTEAFSVQTIAGPNGFVSIEDGTTNNRIQVRRAGQNLVVSDANIVVANGTTQATFTGTVNSWAVSTFAKTVLAYKVNDIATTLNAGTVQTDTSAVIPVVDRMIIGGGSGIQEAKGCIKKIAFFPRRLPNAELVEMTA